MEKTCNNSRDIKIPLISLGLQWLGVLCVSLLAFSCGAPPMNSSHITPMDIKSQNIEKIRAGLEYLLGNDSTGIAAMDYVKAYEDQIWKFYPKDKNTVGTPPPPPQSSELIALYLATSTGGTTVQENQERTRTQLYASFGKEMLRTSRLRLNECYESWRASGDIGSAKAGFAAGYVALTLTPSVADLEEIQNKMVTLLDTLTIKK